MKRIVFFCLVVVLGACSGERPEVNEIQGAVSNSCRPDEIMLVESGECFPVRVVPAIVLPEGVPGVDLREIRSGNSPSSGSSAGVNSFTTCMDHNEIGAGVRYRVGQLAVAGATAALQTSMTIHEGNLGAPYGDPACIIFETATNRTEKGVEVFLAYVVGTPPSLQIFDWSCSASYPCGATSTGPEFVYFEELADLSTCYKNPFTDAGGHSRTRLIYNNETIKGRPAIGLPQAWTNRVSIFNNCLLTWDVIYTHAYRSNQLDCSLDDDTCGWWGPILETNNASQPAIKESGFQASSVLNHGTWYLLTNTNTFWESPYFPWNEFHRTANSEWGVGNSLEE